MADVVRMSFTVFSFSRVVRVLMAEPTDVDTKPRPLPRPLQSTGDQSGSSITKPMSSPHVLRYATS